MKWTLGLAGLLLLLGAPLACDEGDDDDDDSNGIVFDTCPDLCAAAQAASCTVVDCDCNHFCTSLEAFKTKGNCGSQANAYESCALASEPCTVSGNCASQEDAFGACVLTYCATNPNDADCVFLNTC